MNRYEYAARLREPSTWAGLATVTAVFGGNVAPDMWVNIATAVTAALAVFVPESKKDK
jgi:hypothetical protein